MRLLIAHQNTLGLERDAMVLTTALQKAIPDAAVFLLKIPDAAFVDYDRPIAVPDIIWDQAPYDILFLLEHAVGNAPLLEDRLARRVVCIPNLERLHDQDLAILATGRIDTILLKNNFALQMASHVPATVTLQKYLIGWTSVDIGDAEIPINDRDYTRFLHVRGVSVQKQTETVIETWASRPDFPPLLVTMYFRESFSLPAPLRYADNISIQLSQMPITDLRRQQNTIGLHLCPSRAEGFGHSLNEARAANGVLITTDGDPMRDFVEPGANGFLVPVRPARSGPLLQSRYYDITPEDLAQTVETVLATALPRRREMGDYSRTLYLRDRQVFHQRLAAWISA